MTNAWSIAAPSDMTTLAASNVGRSGDTAAKIAPAANSVIPTRCTDLRPAMSASLPSGKRAALIVRDPAIATQDTTRKLNEKSAEIEGKAIPVTEASITIVNNAIATTVNAFHL